MEEGAEDAEDANAVTMSISAYGAGSPRKRARMPSHKGVSRMMKAEVGLR